MINVENIRKEYSGKIILKDVSFKVDQGEIYGLVGKNGAGKTTLLNIMAGIVTPHSGKCLINGKEINRKTIESSVIGYLPDLPTFFDYLTVEEYIQFLKSAGKGQDAFIAQISERISLDKGKQIKKLSRGNRQKLGILATLIGNPQIILLDEPTSALDPIGRKETMEIIRLLSNNGLSIILSTHILTDLETICDKVGFLHEGTIKREIDLRIEDSNEYGFEILFENEIDEEDVDRVLNEFDYSYSDNLLWVSPQRKDGMTMTASDILGKVISLPAEVKNFSRKSKYNLETVMEELSLQ